MELATPGNDPAVRRSVTRALRDAPRRGRRPFPVLEAASRRACLAHRRARSIAGARPAVFALTALAGYLCLLAARRSGSACC